MTTINYTIKKTRHECRVMLTEEPDQRFLDLVSFFWGIRRAKENTYLFTPVRGIKFDKAYRAGFQVAGQQLWHPAIKGRKFAAIDAMQIILLAEAIRD